MTDQRSNDWKVIMKKVPMLGKIAVVMAVATIGALAAGSRVGGDFDISHESLNSGGATFATNGNVKLGGSIGQHGLILIATNTGVQFQNGFWKGEDGCEFYPAEFSEIVQSTGTIAMTFNTMMSNVYTVSSIANEQNTGLLGGTHVWTNIVITFSAVGGFGSQTTVYHNVSALTNAATFYLIRCD
jgi:hypothetical protein